MKTVLVTGAAGYLGGIVVEELAARAETAPETAVRVVAVDVRPPAPGRRRESVVHVQEDVRSPTLTELFRHHRPDTVVHLAAIVNPQGIDRATQYDIDVRGTENVLDACLAAGVRRIVVSSSGAAYGYHPDNPAWITEDQPLRGNEAFAYAHHKRLVEERLAHFREAHPQLEQVVFRIGTILGAGVRNQISALFERPRLIAIRGSDSPFVFIWDRDVAGCIVHAVGPGRPGIYNVAGDGALTIGEIAEVLGKPVVSLPAGLVRAGLTVLRGLGIGPYGPEQLDFLRYRPVLDNTRLKTVFGYVPRKTSREVFELYAGSVEARERERERESVRERRRGR